MTEAARRHIDKAMRIVKLQEELEKRKEEARQAPPHAKTMALGELRWVARKLMRLRGDRQKVYARKYEQEL